MRVAHINPTFKFSPAFMFDPENVDSICVIVIFFFYQSLDDIVFFFFNCNRTVLYGHSYSVYPTRMVGLI